MSRAAAELARGGGFMADAPVGVCSGQLRPVLRGGEPRYRCAAFPREGPPPHDHAPAPRRPLGRLLRRRGKRQADRHRPTARRPRATRHSPGHARCGAFAGARRPSLCPQGMAVRRPRRTHPARRRALRTGGLGHRDPPGGWRGGAGARHPWPGQHLRRLLWLGLGRPFPPRAKPVAPPARRRRRLYRPGDQLFLRRRHDF